MAGLLSHAIRETMREPGWASLAAVGSFISKTNASFAPRNYGYTRLGEMVRKQTYLEVKETPDQSGLVRLHVRPRA